MGVLQVLVDEHDQHYEASKKMEKETRGHKSSQNGLIFDWGTLGRMLISENVDFGCINA